MAFKSLFPLFKTIQARVQDKQSSRFPQLTRHATERSTSHVNEHATERANEQESKQVPQQSIDLPHRSADDFQTLQAPARFAQSWRIAIALSDLQSYQWTTAQVICLVRSF